MTKQQKTDLVPVHGGLDELDDRKVGDLAHFRPMELAAAMNRLRTLELRSTAPIRPDS